MKTQTKAELRKEIETLKAAPSPFIRLQRENDLLREQIAKRQIGALADCPKHAEQLKELEAAVIRDFIPLQQENKRLKERLALATFGARKGLGREAYRKQRRQVSYLVWLSRSWKHRTYSLLSKVSVAETDRDHYKKTSDYYKKALEESQVRLDKLLLEKENARCQESE